MSNKGDDDDKLLIDLYRLDHENFCRLACANDLSGIALDLKGLATVESSISTSHDVSFDR